MAHSPQREKEGPEPTRKSGATAGDFERSSRGIRNSQARLYPPLSLTLLGFGKSAQLSTARIVSNSLPFLDLVMLAPLRLTDQNLAEWAPVRCSAHPSGLVSFISALASPTADHSAKDGWLRNNELLFFDRSTHLDLLRDEAERRGLQSLSKCLCVGGRETVTRNPLRNATPRNARTANCASSRTKTREKEKEKEKVEKSPSMDSLGVRRCAFAALHTDYECWSS